ncbi:hypothetical protein ACEWY4_011774 [Coilia grayii]|uniref:Chemokine interleukin-8-like domain-containing protein n=1 Tax=Coilia grayii TaxID=363190 RepID=A0ABD1JYL5_9TELE
MNALTLTLFCFVLLGIVPSKGQVGRGLQRCTCKTEIQRVRKQQIKSVHILPESPSCSKTEIMVVLKRNQRVCLDPKGKQGKRLLKRQSEQIQGKIQKPRRKQNKKKPN